MAGLGEEQESLKVPEGTATGTMFRLRGKGLPDVRAGAGAICASPCTPTSRRS